MFRTLLLVGTGGFIGSIGRYLMQYAASRHFRIVFPVGTLLVNILGCLLIGFIYGVADKADWLTADWRLFLATGICGGFTTFSTFSYESIMLFKESNYGYFTLYIVVSVLVGLSATFAGIAAINAFAKI